MRKAKVISGSIGLLLCAVLGYELIWGKLLPYSPIILGFRRQECPHVILYTEKDSPFGDYEWVDTLVSGVEQFHDLACKTKPKLFFFGNVGTYARRSPSKARLCAFYNGAVVVSPWVQREDSEGLLSLKVYLIHELSHSVLYQNMDTLRKFRYPRWLMEGVATYSANQMGTYLYPSREETYALIRKGNWMPPEDYNTKKEDQVPLHVINRNTVIPQSDKENAGMIT